MALLGRRTALGLAVASSGAVAWWDNGHMLTAEVAKLSLTPEEAQKFDAVLAAWEADYPGASDMVTSAVWPDLIKCARVSAFCHKDLPDDLEAFEGWHFTDKPYNPDNLELSPLFTKTYNSDPSATWLLSQAMTTFSGSKSRWAWNLMLRFTLHVVGDLHQPLHAVEGFFNDTQFGKLPSGDRGGNSIHIKAPAGNEGATNLHALWDSGAGLYLLDWPYTDDQKAQLAANASELIQSFPKSSLPEYNAADIDACVTPAELRGAVGSRCEAVFERWANETYDAAVKEAYGHGIANGAQPSAEYLANAQAVARRQIALGGYRLADLLRAVVAKLPAPAALPAGQQSAEGTEGSWKPATGGRLELALGAAVAALLLLVLALGLALRQSKEAHRHDLLQQQRQLLLVEAPRVTAN